MSNLNVTGNIYERGSRVYSPNNPPSLSVSSRCVNKDIGGQSQTGKFVATGFTSADLQADEVVSGVYAFSKSAGAYNNNNFWYMTYWRWNDANLEVYIQRGANDQSPGVKVSITLLKTVIV